MGMYATKSTEQDSLCLRMQWLKKNGYLCGYKGGGITWTWGFDCKSSISFIVDTMDSPEIKFQYTVTNQWSGEKKDMNYSFPLIKVPCNLGGFRWAFRCSLHKNNRYCGRLAYKLYKAPGSNYFGCRKCMSVVYESQRDCGKKFEYFGKILKLEKKYHELYESIHKWHYKGMPTKKVVKLKRMENQMPSIEEKERFERYLLGK